MHRFKSIVLVLPLLLIVSVASQEAQDEWAAKQYVEKTNRAMFCGHPIAEPSADNGYIQPLRDRR